MSQYFPLPPLYIVLVAAIIVSDQQDDIVNLTHLFFVFWNGQKIRLDWLGACSSRDRLCILLFNVS